MKREREKIESYAHCFDLELCRLLWWKVPLSHINWKKSQFSPRERDIKQTKHCTSPTIHPWLLRIHVPAILLYLKPFSWGHEQLQPTPLFSERSLHKGRSMCFILLKVYTLWVIHIHLIVLLLLCSVMYYSLLLKNCSLSGSSIYGISQTNILSGLPFPLPGNLPSSGIEPGSPALEADALTSEQPGKPSLYQLNNIHWLSTVCWPCCCCCCCCC